MGQPMARRLAQAGFRVVGFNRTRSRAEALQRDGVEVADTPEQACDVDLLISMVTDDEAIEQLFWQDERFLTMGHPGLVHAGMSTISDTLAARLAAAFTTLAVVGSLPITSTRPSTLSAGRQRSITVSSPAAAI